ncbi:MAG: hypothetical protein ACOZAJ_01175 [Patescibacteria group bacterium]
MPIIDAALLPNSPLLLPGLKDGIRQAAIKTSRSVGEVGLEMSLRRPDIIFLLSSPSPDDQLSKSGWAFLQNSVVQLNYPSLGDFISQAEVKIAVGFTHRLKESLESVFPIPLISQANLPYTAGVPLLLLGKSILEIPLVYLQIPQQISLDNLSLVSRSLHEQLQSGSSRVALLASGELGRVTKDNQVEAKLFNQQFLNFCQTDDWDSIFNLPIELLTASRQTIWSPAVLLKSLLPRKKIVFNAKSFEAPYEAGWLVAELAY